MDRRVEELRHSDFRPWPSSWASAGRTDTARRDHPAGRGTAAVTGKVDRVDGWLRDGKALYPRGGLQNRREKFDLADVRATGLDIQMLLYLFALRDEGRNLSARRLSRQGVLYLPARDEILPADRAIPPEALKSARGKELQAQGLGA